MDERIINILDILDKDSTLTQREIASRSNIGLGTVNSLIKHCINKGLIKVKRLNSRNVQYLLTYDGIKELTGKSISYIQKSYQAIVEIQNKVREIAEEQIGQGKRIILLCKEDEIYQIAVDTMKESNIDYYHYTKFEELPEEIENLFILYWDPVYDDIKDMDIESRNMFNRE